MRCLVLLAFASGCSYGVTFADCEVQCSGLTDCPSGFQCGEEGLCRLDGVAATCAEVIGGGDDSGFVGDLRSYLKASNADVSDRFGHAVALSGDGRTLAIGAPNEESRGDQNDNSAMGAGAVYVFTRSGATWVQEAYIKAFNVDANDQFGTAVALSADGNTLAVGAPRESSAGGLDTTGSDNSAIGAGAVYVFVRDQATWFQQAYVKASNPDPQDELGRALALSASGSTLVVGAALEDSGSGDQTNNDVRDSGAAYVFERDANNAWVQRTYLKRSTPLSDDKFATAVAISPDGNTIAVGAPNASSGELSRSGSVEVFVRDGESFVWPREVVLVAPEPDIGDLFGSCVALSADGATLATGAPNENSDAVGVGGAANNDVEDAGAAYVFRRTRGIWNAEAYVKATNTDAHDELGCGLALSSDGDTLVVGAPQEASGASGLDGNANDNSLQAAGAAYILVRTGTKWTHHTYVKATNPGDIDAFGRAVALSANASTAAFGAELEDSAARGIDGDQGSESAMFAGAVYVYF